MKGNITLTKRTKLTGPIAVVAAAITFTACGGGSPDTASTGGGGLQPSTTATVEPVEEATEAPTPTTTPTGVAPSTTVPVEPVETLPRPAALAALPSVTLVAPGAIADTPTPEFTWAPVEGAVTYRLAVLAPDRPLWSWTGSATSVTLGLVTPDRSAAAPALALEPGSTWSVAALDSDGNVLAVSPQQMVAPAR